MAASEVPLAIIDGELGRIVQGPAVTTWPRLQPAGVVTRDGGPDKWDEIAPNQRFVPQSPPIRWIPRWLTIAWRTAATTARAATAAATSPERWRGPREPSPGRSGRRTHPPRTHAVAGSSG